MSKTVVKPNPTPTPVTASFWKQASEHKLELQRCNDCHKAIFYPRRHCPHCWGLNLSSFQSSGKGVVASIVEVHRAGHPAFQADTPYYVALIDLAEGVRLLSNVSDPAAKTVPIGAAVELTWRQQNEFVLPVFTVSPNHNAEQQYE